ncbi:hypothetical protein OPV22_021225 [Ensete ventricosum]|uniref:Uncharacterized protein n=1 Tax=Ensete ventricosum TaxID=4639 RepID=A0AAV8QKR0_ENSVE|nr:hypothetical protein OPV22_021225 [Ensete ventricosum]
MQAAEVVGESQNSDKPETGNCARKNPKFIIWAAAAAAAAAAVVVTLSDAASRIRRQPARDHGAVVAGLGGFHGAAGGAAERLGLLEARRVPRDPVELGVPRGPSSPSDVVESMDYDADQVSGECKHYVLMHMGGSLVFYCVSAGGQALIRDAPQLCRLWHSFPSILITLALALLLAVAYVSSPLFMLSQISKKVHLHQLPMYKFRRIYNSSEILLNEVHTSKGGMIKCDSDEPIEHVLLAEDAVFSMAPGNLDPEVNMNKLFGEVEHLILMPTLIKTMRQ